MSLAVPNISALLLAIVFLVAGVNKLRRPLDTRRSLRDFGLPAPRQLSIALPLVELLTAFLLIINPATEGPCAVALLSAFTVLLIGRLRAGLTQGCGCFGAWSTRPLSWRDVARNLILIAFGVTATLG